jgi:hypothetical protein
MQHHPVPLSRMTHITTAQRKLHPSGGHFSFDDQRRGLSCKNVQYANTLTVPDRDFCVLQASKTWDEHVRSSGLPENRDTAITLMSVLCLTRVCSDMLIYTHYQPPIYRPLCPRPYREAQCP